MQMRKIDTVEELFPILDRIGDFKNSLHPNLRGWVNSMGLYVQLNIIGTHEHLTAGGKYRKYFHATRDIASEGALEAMFSDDISQWKLKNYDWQTWDKRFVHLVEPTFEIAFVLARDGEQSLPKIVGTVDHFKSTGEWLGIYPNQCISCGESISYWLHFSCGICPNCGSKVRD
ncbi:hypothetical protein ACFLU3_00730 [Chloroflexota bacterium]